MIGYDGMCYVQKVQLFLHNQSAKKSWRYASEIQNYNSFLGGRSMIS